MISDVGLEIGLENVVDMTTDVNNPDVMDNEEALREVLETMSIPKSVPKKML